MVYVPHVRVSAIFSLGNPDPLEAASCTLNFIPPSIPMTSEGRQNLVNDCFTDWAAWVSAADSRVANTVRLEKTKLWMIGSDGKATEDTVESTGAPVRGGAGAYKHPFQISNVITLVAGERGRGRFGRIYLPPQSFEVNDIGQVYGDHLATMWAQAQLLLTNLSNKPGLDGAFQLAIAGRTGPAGTLRPVTSIRMGKVSDTQRRRRRNMSEQYLTSGFDA